MYKVYKLTFSSGKIYIGQTARPIRIRMIEHRCIAKTSQLPVYCAWRDQGEPIAEVLAEYETQQESHFAEKAAISLLDTLHPQGYNVSRGGKQPDVQWTDEMRDAAANRSKRRWEARKAEGWTMSESHRQRLKERVFSAETRAKMSAAAKGKPKAPRSAEVNAKIAERTKAAWSNPEITAKRTASIRAAWTPEKKAEMAAKAAELWKNPEIRAKRLEAMRKAKTDK